MLGIVVRQKVERLKMGGMIEHKKCLLDLKLFDFFYVDYVANSCSSKAAMYKEPQKAFSCPVAAFLQSNIYNMSNLRRFLLVWGFQSVATGSVYDYLGWCD
jgi:hypothetical protein